MLNLRHHQTKPLMSVFLLLILLVSLVLFVLPVFAVPSGSIVINQGEYTTSPSVTLILTYTDNATGSSIRQARYGNNDSGQVNWSAWEDPRPTKTWTLTSGDGTKTVYYQVRNDANQNSIIYSDSIILDTQKPVGSIIIAGGNSYTNKTNVSLNLTASDVTSGVSQMQLSTDGIFDTEAWENFTSSKTSVLSSNDGMKNVWVRFRDKAGLVSDVYNDSIILDTTLPTATILTPVEGITISSSDVNAQWTGADTGSGIGYYETQLDSGTWINKGSTATHTFVGLSNGKHSISLRVVDKAGNLVEYVRNFSISQAVQRTLTVSSAHGNPNPPAGKNYYTNGQSITASVSSSVIENGTTWTCTGWTGTGSVPASGSTASIIFTIDQDSSITWNWRATISTGTLSGNVRSSTGGLITSATVQYSGQVAGSITSNSSGGYTIPNLPLGSYSITVSKTGFVSQTKTATVNIGVTTLNFILEPNVAPPGTPLPDDGFFGWSTSNSLTFTWPSIGSSVSGYYWRIDNGSEGMTTITSVTLPQQVDGTHIFQVRAKDKNGNYSPYGNHTFQIDTVPPEGSVSINQGAAFTVSTSVSLALTYYDETSGVDKVRFSNDGVWDTELWEDPLPIKAWLLSDVDGTNSVYVQIKDEANLLSTFSETIILDTIPPTGSIKINNDSPETNVSTVTLTLTAADVNSVDQMRFSNDGSSWSVWEDFAATKAWTLNSNDGTQTVYAQFKDAAGLDSLPYSDMIVLKASQSSQSQPSSSSGNSSPSSSSSSQTSNRTTSTTNYGNLTVTVKDSNGNPIVGVAVISISQPQNQTRLNGMTDQKGQITFSDVLAGPYTIQAKKGTFQADNMQTTVDKDEVASVEVTLNVSEEPSPNPVDTQDSTAQNNNYPTPVWQIALAVFGGIFVVAALISIIRDLRSVDKSGSQNNPMSYEPLHSEDR